ncbi:MBL fold metallo-hydrolase [Fodinicola acaciae]|uniref:MBL fold metallo-hydrolase n=1 Tax=Fodinicola acaciae TaxID=2681555 RepID=UPI0013D67264|nr:MBL fold metallo-hydrolase [Fodinicola acaciae]
MTTTLRVLGNNTPFPAPGRPGSGYLLTTPHTKMLIDLGYAVWPELLRYAHPNDLDAVWISHLHPDHCADLFAAYQWAGNVDDARRVTIYGPAGWVDRIGAALPYDDGPDRIRRVLDTREHSESGYDVGDLHVTAVPVQHSVPTHGLRVTSDSGSLAYSADSGACPALNELANGVEVFLCEAGASEQQPFHCTPEEAVAAGLHAQRLVLTHLSPALTPDEASQRAGGATVAQPGMVFDCTAS